MVGRLLCPNEPQNYVGPESPGTVTHGDQLEGDFPDKPRSNPKSSTMDHMKENVSILMSIKKEAGFNKMEVFCHLGFSLAAGLISPPCQDRVVAVTTHQLHQIKQSYAGFYHRKQHAVLYQTLKGLCYGPVVLETGLVNPATNLHTGESSLMVVLHLG